MHFSKPPLHTSQQVALLIKRGLIIADPAKAELYLGNIGYYHLSAYMLPFQIPGDSNHTYLANTSFEDVLDLYVFDRELRLLVFDAIERVELAVRTQIIYQLSHKYGSHWQDNPSLFRNPATYTNLQDYIDDLCRRPNKEVFIDHYLNKYTSPLNPPSWMCLELITMGQLSFIFRDLANKNDKSSIAAYFKVHPTVLDSWLHAISYVRNICAHHSRLWNRELAIRPTVLIKPMQAWINLSYTNNRRSYYLLAVLQYLLQTANPGGDLPARLKKLIADHPKVKIAFMGFPAYWQSEPLWQ